MYTHNAPFDLCVSQGAQCKSNGGKSLYETCDLPQKSGFICPI